MQTEDRDDPADETQEDLDATWKQIAAEQDGEDGDAEPPAQEAGRPDAVDTEAAHGAAADDAEDGERPTTADWDSAPEPLKAEMEAMRAELARVRQQAQSAEGRAVAHQRELMAARQARTEKPKTPEHLAAAAEEYPEIAEPFIREIMDLRQTVEMMQGTVGSVTETVAAQREVELESLAPGWKDDIIGNRQAFDRWLEDDAPGRLQRAYAANARGITDPRSAAEVVTAFREHIGKASPSQRSGTAPGHGQIADRRQRQLRGSRSPGGSGVPAASGIPAEGDLDAMWKAIGAEVDKDLGLA